MKVIAMRYEGFADVRASWEEDIGSLVSRLGDRRV